MSGAQKKGLICLVVAGAFSAILLCCSRPANKPYLTAKASKEGVEFSVDPTWKNTLSESNGSIEPASNNAITVTTYRNREAQSLESINSANAKALGANVSDYQLDMSKTLSNDVKVRCYTAKKPADSKGDSVTSVAIASTESGKGFLIFFNRGNVGDNGQLDDDTYKAIVESITFDPSKAAPPAPSGRYGTNIIGSGAGASGSGSSANTVNAPSASQQSALNAGKRYLRSQYFSYDGLIEQLEFEKFSHEDATYAADNCGADWNQQALGKAKSYLSSLAFSYEGLIEQLEFEGFTEDQAAFGAEHCNADWNEQAKKKARSYQNSLSLSRDGLIDQLMYDGFSYEQAEYGVSAIGM